MVGWMSKMNWMGLGRNRLSLVLRYFVWKYWAKSDKIPVGIVGLRAELETGASRERSKDAKMAKWEEVEGRQERQAIWKDQEGEESEKEVQYTRPALGPTQPPIQLVLGAKRSGREADNSPPSSTEVKECVAPHLHPNTSSWRDAN
jgi:hypothetical protein